MVDNDPLEEVELRTGAKVPRVMVMTVKIVLQGVEKRLKAGVLADCYTLYDLVAFARDPQYDDFYDLDTLKATKLVEPDGTMKSYNRDIILALTEGEGLYIHIVNPFPPSSQP